MTTCKDCIHKDNKPAVNQFESDKRAYWRYITGPAKYVCKKKLYQSDYPYVRDDTQACCKREISKESR